MFNKTITLECVYNSKKVLQLLFLIVEKLTTHNVLDFWMLIRIGLAINYKSDFPDPSLGQSRRSDLAFVLGCHFHVVFLLKGLKKIKLSKPNICGQWTPKLHNNLSLLDTPVKNYWHLYRVVPYLGTHNSLHFVKASTRFWSL